jgi:hypothetical protein
MDARVFDQRRSPETLMKALNLLLDQWLSLPVERRRQIDERRRQLGLELPSTPPLQRAGRIIAFLSELESMGEVAAIVGPVLEEGKGPSYRLIVQFSDDQLRDLLVSLATPAPEPEATAVEPAKIPFQLHMTTAPPSAPGAPIPLIFHLTPDTRPVSQRSDALLIPFSDLRQPVRLEIQLKAPGFTEATGDWTRLIRLSPLGEASLPAVFLVQGGGATGEQALWVQINQVAGSVLRKFEIVSPLEAKSILPPNLDAGPLRSAATPAQREFYTDVQFPSQVLPRTVHPLVVRLTLEQSESSRVAGKAAVSFENPHRAEWIEVVVDAPGFNERSGNSRRIFHLYSEIDSQPAVFLLEAGATRGSYRVTVDFYHQGRLLLNTFFETAIVEQLATAPPKLSTRADAPSLEPIPQQPPAPPDLELRILFDPQSRLLRFRLHSEYSDVGYRDYDAGSVQLQGEPQQIFEQKFIQLNTLATEPAHSTGEQEAAEHMDELIAIGQNLFGQLFPPKMQREYWRIKQLREEGKIRTLLILSDEPWIPWELLKPFYHDRTTGQMYEDGFLAEVFHLARWLTERGVAPDTDIRAARLVAPTSNLAYAEEERRFFADLHRRGVEVGEPLALRTKVFEAFSTAKVKLLHVAAHGNFKYENVNDSVIELDNNEYLRPDDLAPVRTKALRQERPLVFLNACHGGQLGFYLTGLGGWANRMVADIGVSAFVGALWEINDQLAAAFAVEFYQQLMAGCTLAEAMNAARLHIRELAPANPTWLAYTLYADPNARVRWSVLRPGG